MTHRHRPKSTRTRCFCGPAAGARHQNQAAHGNICQVATCACGAIRERNINGPYVETGAWIVGDTPAPLDEWERYED